MILFNCVSNISKSNDTFRAKTDSDRQPECRFKITMKESINFPNVWKLDKILKVVINREDIIRHKLQNYSIHLKETLKQRSKNQSNDANSWQATLKIEGILGIGGPCVNLLTAMCRDHSDETSGHQILDCSSCKRSIDLKIELGVRRQPTGSNTTRNEYRRTLKFFFISRLRTRSQTNTTLHNGMILSTLSISSHGFALGFPKRPRTNGVSIPHL